MRKAAVSRLRRRRSTTHNSTLSLSLSVTRSHRQQQPLPDGNEMFIRDYVYVKAKYKRSTYRTLRAQKIPHAMQASVCERVVDYEKKCLSMRRS